MKVGDRVRVKETSVVYTCRGKEGEIKSIVIDGVYGVWLDSEDNRGGIAFSRYDLEII